MNKPFWSPLLIIIALGPLYLPVSLAKGESPADPSSIQIVSSQSQPGSKEPEGLEPEPPANFSIGWDITLASKYIFQGIDYSEGNKHVVQPEVTLTVKDFSAILWFNYDLHAKKFNEIDLYLQYSREIENLILTAGYGHFNYDRVEWDQEQEVFIEWEPSQEVFIDLSYNTLLNPYLSIHYDFDAGEGSYSTLGISHGMETPLGALSLGTNIFYQANYYGFTGFPSMELNGAMEYSIGPFTITPSISYFLTWENGDFTEDGPEGPVPDTWLFSINVAQSF